jgi:pimeloyl-ACP methyl ester carboxylesterase
MTLHDAELADQVKHHTVTGGAHARLHVVETGNPCGRPLLFLHGLSQSWFSWRRQLCSDLSGEYRLVALDLRGHGESDKPRDGYGDSTVWADDVRAVMRELALDQPVLCGWSYGPLVMLDYIRTYGEDAISGCVFVDALTRLGSDAALAVLTPELLSLVPGLFSTDVDESVRTLESFVRLCFLHPPTTEELYLMLGYNVAVPPHVRQALFSRSVDNDDVLACLGKPVMVVHGADDAIVRPTIVEQHAAALQNAQTCVMPNAGHSPFWDDAQTFNEHLRTFCTRL